MTGARDFYSADGSDFVAPAYDAASACSSWPGFVMGREVGVSLDGARVYPMNHRGVGLLAYDEAGAAR